MKLIKYCFFSVAFLFLGCSLEATIRLTEVLSQHSTSFPFHTGNGLRIDKEGARLTSTDGEYTIFFEDAGRSGFHRPHWKFHVWLENKTALPLFASSKILYAVIFYDGEGEVKLHIDREGKLHVIGGRDVKDVLYPWAKGTIGRGNPYHQIAGTEVDDNGIKFFDYNGFVAYPENRYVDPGFSFTENDKVRDDSYPKPHFERYPVRELPQEPPREWIEGAGWVTIE